jgi:CheY-like chemotaxis protein
MYNALIVEDFEPTLKSLSRLLTSECDQLSVGSAKTIAEADAKIETAISEGLPYDLVIVDYMLPKEAGLMPEPALALTSRIMDKLPEALIIQITAYRDDESLQKSLIHPMLTNPDPRLLFVEKTDDWSADVVRLALQRVLGDPIEEQLDNLFGPDPSSNSIRRSRSGRASGSRSMTQGLASLRALVGTAWEHISPELQKRIRSKVKVDDRMQPVRITMIDIENK